MSTPVLVHEFSITRDFRSIRWGATLWYNLIRSMAAGLVLGVLISFSGQQGAVGTAFGTPFIWPIIYLICLLPFGMIFGVVGQFVPIANLFTLFVALLAVTIGDPIVCILHKFFPKLVPVAAPSLFSFSLIQWVVDTENEFSIAL